MQIIPITFTNQLYLQKSFTIIEFHNIPDYFSLKGLEHLLVSYVDSFGYSIDQLVYNFVSKEKMLSLNQQFLNHYTHTDIISFDYSKNKSLRAEFFISPWAISHSAKTHLQSTENETIRVVIHGVLHCLGYKDDTEANKLEMRKKEDEFIKMFHVKHKSHV